MTQKKSSKQRELEGCRAHRPNPDDDPDSIGVPKKPINLSPVASACWDAIQQQVIHNGAAAADAMRLGGLCRWYGRYIEAETALASLPITDPGYYRIVTLAAIAWKQFDSAASKFGLAPSDRARLHVSKDNEDDPLKKFGITG